MERTSLPRLGRRFGTVEPVWLVVAVFFLLQVVIIFAAANGPFIDEGIETTVGMRVLQGYGISDGYLGWVNGSPFVWPVLAAWGYYLGGLAGARLTALALTTLALVFFARATHNLFGKGAAFWGTVALSLNGLVIALGHFAVYDTLALAALAISFWQCTEFLAAGRWRSSLLAGMSFGIAAVAKYGYAVMLAPLLGVLLVRPDTSLRKLAAPATLAGVSGAIISAYCFTAFGTWLPASYGAYAEMAGRFERARLVSYLLYLCVAPLMLTAVGFVIAWRNDRRWLATVLGGALFVTPAFHLWSQSHVSVQKHVVMGFLCAFPLAGVALDAIWRSRARWGLAGALLVLAGWGVVQWRVQEWSWEDTRPVASYLLRQVRPGDRLAATDSWVYAMSLYPAGLIASPFEIVDHWAIEHTHPDLCTFPWLIGRLNEITGREDEIRQAARRCGHRSMLRSTTVSVALDARWRPAASRIAIEVYHRESPLR